MSLIYLLTVFKNLYYERTLMTITKINFNKKTNIEDEEIKSFSAGNHKLPPVDVQKIIRVVSF